MQVFMCVNQFTREGEEKDLIPNVNIFSINILKSTKQAFILASLQTITHQGWLYARCISTYTYCTHSVAKKQTVELVNMLAGFSPELASWTDGHTTFKQCREGWRQREVKRQARI